MRNPSTYRGRRVGALAVAAVAAAGLALATGPADAAQAARATPGTTVADCDPVGNIFLNPSADVVSGSAVSVSWSTRNVAACNVNVEMSGPGFAGTEVVSGSGSRQVLVTQAGPSTAEWTLSIASSRGHTDLASASVLVTAPEPPTDPSVGGAGELVDSTGRATMITGGVTTTSNGPGVQVGSHPSLANVGTHYVSAYTASDGTLWVVDQSGAATDTGQAVRAGTSPSIVAIDGSDYLVAFQGGDTVLRTYSSTGVVNYLGLAMDPASSPSATLTTAGVAIAYVDENGWLSVHDPALGYGGFGVSVADGSSPALTYILGSPDSYRIAYEGTDRVVHTVDSSGAAADTPLTAAAGTDPAITTLPSGQIDIAVNASDGTTKYTTTRAPGVAVTINDPSGFQGRTSPTIAAEASGGGAVVGWQAQDAMLHLYTDDAGLPRPPSPCCRGAARSGRR